MNVRVGSILHEYTGGASSVEAEGRTLRALFADLDRRYPGLRFRVVDEQDRIRPHIQVFVGQTKATGLDTAVQAGTEVHILGALSGG